jgi:hypothetical protein
MLDFFRELLFKYRRGNAMADEKIAIQQVGGIPDKIFGWLPVYSLVRSIVIAGFLVTRVSVSQLVDLRLRADD